MEKHWAIDMFLWVTDIYKAFLLYMYLLHIFYCISIFGTIAKLRWDYYYIIILFQLFIYLFLLGHYDENNVVKGWTGKINPAPPPKKKKCTQPKKKKIYIYIRL